MEYHDIYDKNRKLTGRVKERREKLEDNELILCVGVWLFGSDHRILMIQRHPDKSFAPLMWDCPAGHAIAGETSCQAALRELFEETGITATEDELIFIGTHTQPHIIGDNYCLYRDMPASDIVFQEGETCAAKWVTYDEMLLMAERGEIGGSTMINHLPMQKQFLELLNRENA